MLVRCGVLLEAALPGEERTIKHRNHGEHAAHDGTCPVRASGLSGSRGKKIRTYEATKSKSAQTTGEFRDGQ